MLVTGGSGFIGAHLVAELIAQKADVTCLLRASSDRWRFDALGIQPHILVCEMDDTAQLDALLRPLNVHYVFHLAAERDAAKLEQADHQKRSAVSGANVLQSVASPQLLRFVSVGSAAEVPDRETQAISSTHGRSKARELQTLRALADSLDMPFSPTRTHYVYGPLQSETKLVPVAIKAAQQGLPISLTGSEIRKRYVYVRDLVNALLEVPDHPVADAVQLIVGSQQVSNRDVVEKIETLVGKPITINGDVFVSRAFDRDDWDLSGAGTPFPFSQVMTTLDDGLRATIAWEAKAHV